MVHVLKTGLRPLWTLLSVPSRLASWFLYYDFYKIWQILSYPLTASIAFFYLYLTTSSPAMRCIVGQPICIRPLFSGPHEIGILTFLSSRLFHRDRAQIHGLHVVSHDKEPVPVGIDSQHHMWGFQESFWFIVSCNKERSYVLFITFGNEYISGINKAVALNANINEGWSGSFLA